MEIKRRSLWEVFLLDRIYPLRQKVGVLLERSDARQDEVLVSRIVRIARFIQVEEMHRGPVELTAKKRRLTGFRRRTPKKGALSVAEQSSPSSCLRSTSTRLREIFAHCHAPAGPGK